MRLRFGVVLASYLLVMSVSAFAQDAMLERMLRAQIFNKVFEGFDYYSVTIEDEQAQGDGSREVTVVASGKFMEHTKRLKVVFLIVGDQVIGGQVLEGTDLPPCLAPVETHSSAI